MIQSLLVSILFVPLPSLESDIVSLQKALDNKAQYDMAKEQTIEKLRSNREPARLYEAYNSYCYDSAYHYAQECVVLSDRTGDCNQKADARLKMAYTYMSGGLFQEAESVLNGIDLQGVNTHIQMGYYSQRGQLLYNVARYQQTPYPSQMRDYYEQALKLIPPTDSIGYWSAHAQIARAEGQREKTIYYFEQALKAGRGIVRSEAISFSSLAQEYYEQGDSAQALHYWIQAAIRDLECSVKEVTAMQQAAYLLFALGRYDIADRAIRSAFDDAQLFHARHRQLEVGEILPLIDQQQLQQIQKQNRKERILYICIVAILLVGTGTLLVLFRKLHHRNVLLVEAQERNRLANIALEQSNHLKETYLATMLSAEADHTKAVERYVRYVTRCAREKNWNDVLTIPNYISKMWHRTAFYKRFDTMFLQLYPHFIDEVNAQLTEPLEAKRGTLPSELRIFALMRLGITNNEQMAHILSCSLSTIHTYKAHVYSRLKCSKDSFLHETCG